MPGEFNEQHARKTAVSLGLPIDFIRKDYFITKAIRLLMNVQNDYFELIFQGGTSLSKGYGLINRLSEDIDFRVCLKSAGLGLGKNAKRAQLRLFRNALVQTLIQAGFDIQPEHIKVFYEGRYMSIRASFTEANDISYLKPHIAIDCFVGELLLDPRQKDVSSMIKMVLGDESDHIFFPVACVALEETAAEKWVALTRRIAGTSKKERESDKHLVRHLYDLYQLGRNDHLSDKYAVALDSVLKKERMMFETTALNTTYLNQGLYALRNDAKWEQHWVEFLEHMVYQPHKPSFEEAVSVVEQLMPTGFLIVC